MVEKKQSLGSAKRFGARYGTRTKNRFAKIEKVLKGKHKCPYCNAMKVKRLAVGIWNCRKCGAKFTGKAYSVSKEIVLEEETSESKKEVKKEEE